MSTSDTDPSLLRIREQISDAANEKRSLNIIGGNTRQFYGQAAVGDPLDVKPYTGIVSYEPTELVVTARAGTSLSELESVLASNSQYLPFEPPSFAAESTLGGMVATGLSGPRRASAGSVRDYVLGCNMVDSSGQWLAFGGQVMKNVAGYDLSRLLTGSLGVLGIIAEVSLKVLPQPASEETVSLVIEEADAIRLMNQLAGQPVPISATSWYQGSLRIRFSGAASATRSAVQLMREQYQAESEAAGGAHWLAVCNHRHAFFDGADSGAALWRLSVPSTAPVIDLSGEELIEWGGALRWWRTEAPATTIRAAAHAVGGTATLFRGGDKSVGVFDALPAPLATIHQRLKTQLDPHGLFNPGRLYPDL